MLIWRQIFKHLTNIKLHQLEDEEGLDQTRYNSLVYKEKYWFEWTVIII